MIKVRREDAIMSEDPPTDALEGVEVRKRIYTEQIVSEDRTPHDKDYEWLHECLWAYPCSTEIEADQTPRARGSCWGVPPALAGIFLERYDRRSGPKACNH